MTPGEPTREKFGRPGAPDGPRAPGDAPAPNGNGGSNGAVDVPTEIDATAPSLFPTTEPEGAGTRPGRPVDDGATPPLGTPPIERTPPAGTEGVGRVGTADRRATRPTGRRGSQSAPWRPRRRPRWRARERVAVVAIVSSVALGVAALVLGDTSAPRPEPAVEAPDTGTVPTLPSDAVTPPASGPEGGDAAVTEPPPGPPAPGARQGPATTGPPPSEPPAGEPGTSGPTGEPPRTDVPATGAPPTSGDTDDTGDVADTPPGHGGDEPVGGGGGGTPAPPSTAPTAGTSDATDQPAATSDVTDGSAGTSDAIDQPTPTPDTTNGSAETPG